jgi:putative ABC transport system permease protein
MQKRSAARRGFTRKLIGILTMTFRNPFLNWLATHPVAALLSALGLLLFFLAILPLLLYMTPITKVPLRYNIRNLQNRWITTLVTGLAFTAVVALLTYMLCFVRGMERLTEASGNPGNVMVLSDGATDEAFSNLPPFSVQLLPKDLQDEVVLAAQEVYVVVMYMIPNASEGARARRFTQLRGFDNMQIAAEIHDVKLGKGDWPSPAGVRKISDTETALEIVVGHGVARTFGADLGKPILEIGDTVTLGPRKWVVVGIMKEGSASFSSEIWTRDLHVQENFGRPNSYCSYVIRTASADKANLAVEELKNFKSERNLQAFTEKAYYAKMNETSKQFNFAAYIVGVIMALGGVLGIMNTMFAAISQRGKDIGVLRLMGYRRWQILLCFQFEAVLIALLGGLLGCLITYLAADGKTATSLMSSGGGGGGKTVVLRYTFDFGILFTGIIFSIMMGALGGLLPSWNAMRLRPLESLK